MSAVLTPPDDDLRDEVGDPSVPAAETPARVSAWVAVAAVVLAVILAPPSGDVFASGEFGRVAAGELALLRDGVWAPLRVGDVVTDGSTIRTTTATAELDVRDGQLSLSRWAELRVDGQDAELERGELLFEADRAYQVRLGALVGTGRGTWRVSAGGAVRYAVYEGGVGVSQPGIEDVVAVGRYREAPVNEGAVGAVRPLRYLQADVWDARLLAEALRIDRLLAATRRGLAVRYGEEPQTAAFYADFTRFEDVLDELPALAVVVGADRFGPPAETLVALLVAELIVTSTGRPAAEVAAAIDRLRAAGAEWGIILREHGLAAGDLDAAIERAVRQRGDAVAGGTAAPVAGPQNAPPPADPASPPDDDPTPPDPTPPDPTPPDPPDDDDDDEDPGTLDPVTDPVTSTVDDLGALLDEVVPGASDVTDTVNDVVDETADTVDDLLP